MDWDLTHFKDGVSLGRVANYKSSSAGHGQNIVGLHPGLVVREFPRGETPKQAELFISRFMRVGGDFPAIEFRAPGWLHSTAHVW